MSEIKDMAIYAAIDALEEYLNSCGGRGLSGITRSVRIDEMNSLISDIRTSISDDVRRAQSILSEAESYLDRAHSQADDIVKDANARAAGIEDRAKRNADSIISNANLQREQLLDEHEVTLAAQQQRKEMIEKTEEVCREAYNHARVEAHELLNEVEDCLDACFDRIKTERERIGGRNMRTRYVTEEAAEEPEEEVYANLAEEPEETVSPQPKQDKSERAEKQEPQRPARKEPKAAKPASKILDKVNKFFFDDDDVEQSEEFNDSFDD